MYDHLMYPVPLKLFTHPPIHPSSSTYPPALPGGSQGVPRPAGWQTFQHVLGLPPGSPPGGTCLEHEGGREAIRGHQILMPKPPELAPLDILTISLRERPTTLRRKLISASYCLAFRLWTKVHGHRREWGHRVTGKWIALTGWWVCI